MKSKPETVRVRKIIRSAKLGLLSVVALVAVGLMSSCASEAAQRKKFEAMMGPVQPPLQGQAKLLADRVLVQARLDDLIAAIGMDPASGDKRPGSGPPGGMPQGSPAEGMGGGMSGGLSAGMGGGMPGGGRHGGMGGGGMPGGGGGMPGGGGGMPGGVPGGMPDLPPELLAQLQNQMRGAMIKPPRVILRVTLTNKSKEPVDLWIKDLVCPLGNFAVRPEHIMLAPGQQVELEPLTSNTDMRYDQLSVSLTVKPGGKTQSETAAVELKNQANVTHE